MVLGEPCAILHSPYDVWDAPSACQGGLSQPHNAAGAAATVPSLLDAGQRFGQGGCPQKAVLGEGAPRAPLGPELSTRLSPCPEESSAQRDSGFAPQHQGLGPGVPGSSPSRPRALCGCPAPAVPCSPLQVLWPYLLEFVTPIQFTNALTPLCKSLMYLAMKKQEEGENANLIRYDLNGGSQPHPLCPCTLGARLHAGEVPGCCGHSVGDAF